MTVSWRGKAVCQRGFFAVGVGLRSVKRTRDTATRLCPPSRPHPTSSKSTTFPRRSPLFNDFAGLLLAMGLSVSRLFTGLFGKKEMRASSIAMSPHIFDPNSLFRHSYGNAHLLAARE